SYIRGENIVACSVDYFAKAKDGEIFTFAGPLSGQSKYFKSTSLTFKTKTGMVAVLLRCMNKNFQDVGLEEFKSNFAGIVEFR
ncbi:MAG: hypothetical protein AAB966_00235, partial [Patescibacteria group bacterium]